MFKQIKNNTHLESIQIPKGDSYNLTHSVMILGFSHDALYAYRAVARLDLVCDALENINGAYSEWNWFNYSWNEAYPKSVCRPKASGPIFLSA